MTNTDAERVSDIVARLRPSFNTDLPVSHAIDKCREEGRASYHRVGGGNGEFAWEHSDTKSKADGGRS